MRANNLEMARQQAETVGELIVDYKPSGMFYGDTLCDGEREIALGHVVSSKPFSTQHVELFMANTNNQSVAFQFPPPPAERLQQANLSALSMAMGQRIVETCAHTVLVYGKDSLEPTHRLDIEDISGKMLRTGEIESLDENEYMLTMASLAVKRAITRAKDIEERGILNYDLEWERQNILRRLKILTESSVGEQVIDRLPDEIRKITEL